MRLGTSVVFIAAAVLPEGSAVAQFAPSGGAGLHAEESSEPPEPSVTEPPADAEEEEEEEEEEVKHDIAGFDKANLNGFFVQSRDAEFRLTSAPTPSSGTTFLGSRRLRRERMTSTPASSSRALVSSSRVT
jgi:hypothetical protein